MSLLFITFKLIINFLLSVFYVLFSIIFWNFVYGLILSIIWKDVPWPQDSIHIKLAVLFAFSSFVLSVLLRKYLYLWVIDWFKKFILSKDNNSNKTKNINKKKESFNNDSKGESTDDLEIYVNKEIK